MSAQPSWRTSATGCRNRISPAWPETPFMPTPSFSTRRCPKYVQHENVCTGLYSHFILLPLFVASQPSTLPHRGCQLDQGAGRTMVRRRKAVDRRQEQPSCIGRHPRQHCGIAALPQALLHKAIGPHAFACEHMIGTHDDDAIRPSHFAVQLAYLKPRHTIETVLMMALIVRNGNSTCASLIHFQHPRLDPVPDPL